MSKTSNSVNVASQLYNVSSDEALATLTEQLEETSPTFKANKSTLSAAPISGMNVYPAVCPVCRQNYIIMTSDTESSSSNSDSNISANLIIQTPDRMFLSIEELQALQHIITSYMDVENYTNDGEEKVNFAKLSDSTKSISWENIEDKPNVDFTILPEVIEDSHTHENIESIDKLGEDSNNLPTWDGSEWPYPTKEYEMPLDELHPRNIVISSNDPNLQLNNGDIWIRIEDNKFISLNVKYERSKYYSLSIEDILVSILDQVSTSVQNIVSDTIIENHEDYDDLQGGSKENFEHYHLTYDEYVALQNIIQKFKDDKFVMRED